MQSLTIGEVAKAADVGIETVRFYEREGLIPEPARRQSGYRQYPPDTVRRLRFIRRAKELGLMSRNWVALLTLIVALAACEKTTPVSKAQDEKAEHKEGDGHVHKEGDDGHDHKEGDGHDQEKK